jgi:hypothetical protein
MPHRASGLFTLSRSSRRPCPAPLRIRFVACLGSPARVESTFAAVCPADSGQSVCCTNGFTAQHDGWPHGPPSAGRPEVCQDVPGQAGQGPAGLRPPALPTALVSVLPCSCGLGGLTLRLCSIDVVNQQRLSETLLSDKAVSSAVSRATLAMGELYATLQQVETEKSLLLERIDTLYETVRRDAKHVREIDHS